MTFLAGLLAAEAETHGWTFKNWVGLLLQITLFLGIAWLLWKAAGIDANEEKRKDDDPDQSV